jgi:hypothetical protein
MWDESSHILDNLAQIVKRGKNGAKFFKKGHLPPMGVTLGTLIRMLDHLLERTFAPHNF